MEITHLSYAAPLLSLALLWTVAVVTPGPNFFNTAQLAASCSRKHGVVAALGVATGTVLWGLAGGLGIKSLFSDLMPRPPANPHSTVPVATPSAATTPCLREQLAASCAVLKKLGPGVTTATVHNSANDNKGAE